MPEIATVAEAHASAPTTDRASTSDASDEVRYGIRTHSSRSAPIASATRYATSAESIPPDSPSTARSNPAWRSCPRMNAAMTWRATSVSIASSSGRTNSGSAVPVTRRSPAGDVPSRRGPSVASRPHIQAGLGAVTRGRVVRKPRPLGDQPPPLARDQLRPFVAQERQGDPLPPHVGDVDVDTEQPLLEQRRPEDGGPGRADHLRPAPEREALVDAHSIAEHDERRRQLRVRPHQRPP